MGPPRGRVLSADAQPRRYRPLILSEGRNGRPSHLCDAAGAARKKPSRARRETRFLQQNSGRTHNKRTASAVRHDHAGLAIVVVAGDPLPIPGTRSGSLGIFRLGCWRSRSAGSTVRVHADRCPYGWRGQHHHAQINKRRTQLLAGFSMMVWSINQGWPDTLRRDLVRLSNHVLCGHVGSPRRKTQTKSVAGRPAPAAVVVTTAFDP